MATEVVVALIHEDNGVFGISFPDFPGCVSGGDSLEETIAKGQTVLAFHVAGMVEDGDALPRLRTYSELRRDPEFRGDAKGAVISAVSLDLPGKAVRLNISMDENLVDQIDRAATSAGQSRSAYLADAARARLRRSA